MMQNEFAVVFLTIILNWSYFIARKFITKEGKTASRRIFYLAIFSVALSVLIMLLSIATLSGFKYEIEQKISDVQGHFIIDSGKNIESGEPFPISDIDVKALNDIANVPGVTRVIPSASKACIIKSNEELEGLLAKGIESSSHAYFQKSYRVKRLSKSRNSEWCWVSQTTAKRLHIDTGDLLTVVFFVNDENGTNRPRARRLRVSGVYVTGIDKIDAQMVIVDHQMLTSFMPLGNTYTQVEIWKDSKVDIQILRREILQLLPSAYVRLNTLQEYNRLIFDWLAILNTNVVIILVLMALVAITGMCTTLLILIIERTANIGLLMALGARSKDISRLFVVQSLIITFGGIIAGNILTAVGVWGQNTFRWMTLNQEVYFIPYVTLKLGFWDWVWVDAVAVTVIAISLWLPARYIRKIDLIKAISFK